MKRKLLSISLMSLMLSGVTAQITLTTPLLVEVGDVYSYNELSNTSLNLLNGGANQTWDLSTVSGTTLHVDSVVSLSAMSDASNFPQATYGVLGTGNEVYMNNGANATNTIGAYKTGDYRMVYSDFLANFSTPMAYNDLQTDNFSGTYEDFASTATFAITGTAQYKADGYGTLILPHATINNVLRIEIITTTTTTINGGQSATAVDSSYSWYSADYKFPLAQFNISTSNTVSYVSASAIATTVIEQDAYEISVYPNPIQNELNIKGGSNELEVTIFNLLGKNVYSSTFTNKIDTSSLPKGIYIVKIAKENNVVYTEKIIKL